MSINTLIATVKDSSHIKKISYVAESKTLGIEFKGGSSYLYKDVPFIIALNIVSSESQGQYFHKNIKNKFEFEKVT